MGRSSAVCHQSCCQPDVHTDSVRAAEPAAGLGGHLSRAWNHRLGDGRRLEALPLGGAGTDALFALGCDGDGASARNHSDELGRA
jgi:hypothetical protein